ncbi:SusD/RagB family nutrient-binding outer membrane lipoprotein [Bacteroides xylanisolvens]|uniref:SusD/RagB family nutrient-binding outer membrane lipoprotein n=1 Tax=Bacteroides xylanisolvens TaxID=371601 RepID=UPI0038D4FB22
MEMFIKQTLFFLPGQKSSDLLKWKKFANSLRLRLAVRICNADRSKATGSD